MGRRQTLSWSLQPLLTGPLSSLTLLPPPTDSIFTRHTFLTQEAWVPLPPVWLWVPIKELTDNKLKSHKWIRVSQPRFPGNNLRGLLICVRIFDICVFYPMTSVIISMIRVICSLQVWGMRGWVQSLLLPMAFTLDEGLWESERTAQLMAIISVCCNGWVQISVLTLPSLGPTPGPGLALQE